MQKVSDREGTAGGGRGVVEAMADVLAIQFLCSVLFETWHRFSQLLTFLTQLEWYLCIFKILLLSNSLAVKQAFQHFTERLILFNSIYANQFDVSEEKLSNRKFWNQYDTEDKVMDRLLFVNLYIFIDYIFKVNF